MTTAFAASDVVEGVGDVKAAVTKEGLDKRSYNPIRDDVFGGNELAYALTGTGISLVTDIVTGAVIAKIPERISASMAAKSAKRAAKKAARDAAKAAKVAEKAEKTAQTVKVAKTAETVEKTEGAAKAVSAAERFYSKLDALKLKVQEIPHTLTAEEVRACEAVKLRMKGELSAVGKVSVEEVEKIDEAVKAVGAVRETNVINGFMAISEATETEPVAEGTNQIVKKSVPNPNGKKGSVAHQSVVEDIKADADRRGLSYREEYKFDTTGGYKNSRYADVAVYDSKGRVMEIHQVGRTTKTHGAPVSRERKAMHDIRSSDEYKGEKIIYHPYDK